MNKAEFIKSLEALTEELKNEPQISDNDLLKVFKMGYKEGQEDVFRHFENTPACKSFITDVSISEYIQRGPNCYQFQADVQAEVTIPGDVIEMIQNECGFDNSAYDIKMGFGIPDLLVAIKEEINKK